MKVHFLITSSERKNPLPMCPCVMILLDKEEIIHVFTMAVSDPKFNYPEMDPKTTGCLGHMNNACHYSTRIGK